MVRGSGKSFLKNGRLDSQGRYQYRRAHSGIEWYTNGCENFAGSVRGVSLKTMTE